MPCDASLITTTIGYLEFVLATATAGRAAGPAPLETARETDLGQYAGWLDSERIVGNLHRAYRGLDPRTTPWTSSEPSATWSPTTAANR